ncbi:hypothetical protein QQ045_025293 [Rhodiola kirilowii]
MEMLGVPKSQYFTPDLAGNISVGINKTHSSSSDLGFIEMGEVIEELPKAIVRRVVKEKISQCSDAGDMSLHKDALLAFSESARIFIHYLSATANDICKESKRQTMNADDVLKAIEEIDFPEFLGPLKATLEGKKRHREMIQSDSYQQLEYLVVV